MLGRDKEHSEQTLEKKDFSFNIHSKNIPMKINILFITIAADTKPTKVQN